jgi:hypothetical protein
MGKFIFLFYFIQINLIFSVFSIILAKERAKYIQLNGFPSPNTAQCGARPPSTAKQQQQATTNTPRC